MKWVEKAAQLEIQPWIKEEKAAYIGSKLIFHLCWNFHQWCFFHSPKFFNFNLFFRKSSFTKLLWCPDLLHNPLQQLLSLTTFRSENQAFCMDNFFVKSVENWDMLLILAWNWLFCEVNWIWLFFPWNQS